MKLAKAFTEGIAKKKKPYKPLKLPNTPKRKTIPSYLRKGPKV